MNKYKRCLCCYYEKQWVEVLKYDSIKNELHLVLEYDEFGNRTYEIKFNACLDMFKYKIKKIKIN